MYDMIAQADHVRIPPRTNVTMVVLMSIGRFMYGGTTQAHNREGSSVCHQPKDNRVASLHHIEHPIEAEQ